MDNDRLNIVGRFGLENTAAQFPDEVREALAAALNLVDQMRFDPRHSDEPSHIFQAGRAYENQTRDGQS